MATPESCPRAAVVAFTGQFGTAEKSDPGRAFPSRPENRTRCRKIAASNPFLCRDPDTSLSRRNLNKFTPVLQIRIRRIPYVFGPPGSGSGSFSQTYGSGSFHHQAKIVRKQLTPTVLLLLFDFLSMKNDVKAPSTSNRQKNFFF
jgi:hypothetical protein